MAVTLQKPFAWQERDTRQWLASLSLEVLPHEETAGFLDNPLRSGCTFGAFPFKMLHAAPAHSMCCCTLRTASLCTSLIRYQNCIPYDIATLYCTPRNGILLCDVAAAVTGVPVRRVAIPPKDVRAARANILLALDHLGLLGDLADEQLVRCTHYLILYCHIIRCGSGPLGFGNFVASQCVLRAIELSQVEREAVHVQG